MPTLCENLDIQCGLLDTVSIEPLFHGYPFILLEMLAIDGYEPSVVYDNSSLFPSFRFSYRGNIVSIDLREDFDEFGRHADGYYFVDKERFSYVREVMEYIHGVYPVILEKKEAFSRELKAITAKERYDWLERLRKDYAKDPSSVLPEIVREYSLDLPS